MFLLHNAPAYGDECIAKVEAGTVPPYGYVRSDHPATCWRYWNLDRLSKKLDACPK